MQNNELDSSIRKSPADYSEKGILPISWNVLGLPETVTFSSGVVINYSYAADGTKLRESKTASGTTTTTDYTGTLVLEDGTRSRMLFDGGYVSMSDNAYHFFITDHLGSVRVVANSNGVAEEYNHYYPLGGLLPTSTSSTGIQPVKYQGKEWAGAKGLNLYDFGARRYDPATGRWLSPDPLSEKYYNHSPYLFCAANPMRFVDLEGEDIYRYDDKSSTIILYKETNDKYDQIGKFTKDRQSGEYALSVRRNGSARIMVDHIEKGILSDGMSFSEQANVIEIGSESSSPTFEGFQSFIVEFSDMIGKEIAGYYYSGQSGEQYIHIGSVKNNTYNSSISTPNLFSVRPDLLGKVSPYAKWHTHSSRASYSDRTSPSSKDLNYKASHSNEGIQSFFILTKNEYGIVQPYEY